MFSGLIIGILGVWAFFTPFFDAGIAFYAWSHWIAGLIVAVAGLALVGRRATEGWFAAALGAWFFIAGFVASLLVGSALWWNNLLVGLALMVTGFTAARTIAATRKVEHRAT